MEKISIFVVAIVLASLGSPVYAVKNSEAGSQNIGTSQAQQQVATSPSPTGYQIQNQVNTQNQGEASQLRINTQEQMGTVAAQVQDLLKVRTTGGIGEQVRQIAQEQNQAQNQIQTELGKVEARGGLLKSLIGPDYQALKNMQKAMEQNQLRIGQLEQLQNQLANQSDIAMVQETIQALTVQNTALQNRVNLEERSGGMFGWLFKLFAR
ncbi:hypothetical protein A2Z00_01395 [Candidatus Gottesmanbacteria bacterium RBG_13_45_10]|uniref:Uncharacterized protein n=1 Tax=Candidatus Gottesmanbacteria bacterium RBG_13_45_10 TaxID=1798370 RepID=A0A1F5ZI06_9BACT|nr:MAG: hypothetical protein A2Z00_01395 [Candidatus Gottesmanbacteria bacterium RBG_13_45_10]